MNRIINHFKKEISNLQMRIREFRSIRRSIKASNTFEKLEKSFNLISDYDHKWNATTDAFIHWWMINILWDAHDKRKRDLRHGLNMLIQEISD